MGYVEEQVDATRNYISDLLTKVRMGTYDEAQHGSLQDVLEEIERLLP
jgi:hypothetical protein